MDLYLGETLRMGITANMILLVHQTTNAIFFFVCLFVSLNV